MNVHVSAKEVGGECDMWACACVIVTTCSHWYGGMTGLILEIGHAGGGLGEMMLCGDSCMCC